MPSRTPPPRRRIQWRTAHEQAILAEFEDLLAIPNLASDAAQHPPQCRGGVGLFEKRGVKTRLLEVPGAPPVVFGEIDSPGAARTVVFYAHYDGQPLDPKEWATPPWQPVLREGRIYARSASDDKAPIIAIATALDALHAPAFRCAPTSSSSSKARKKPDRRTWRASSRNTKTCWRATSG
jgi:acetylornithine deacetylase/succinyl-diaminopimelate desuccinylase-like protein